MNQSQGRSEGLPQPNEPDGVNTDAIEQRRVSEEFSPKSPPIRLGGTIDAEIREPSKRRDADDSENLPPEIHRHRRATAVRFLGKKSRLTCRWQRGYRSQGSGGW